MARVVHFEIEAADLERAKRFYSTAFGWELNQQGGEYGNYVVLKTGEDGTMGINGGLYQEDQKKLNAFSCTIGVEDIKASIKQVQAAGGKVESEEPIDIPGVGLYAKCEDTEGNKFTLLQPYPGEWMKAA